MTVGWLIAVGDFAAVLMMDVPGSIRIAAGDFSPYPWPGTLLGHPKCVSWIQVPLQDWIEPGCKVMNRREYGSLS